MAKKKRVSFKDVGNLPTPEKVEQRNKSIITKVDPQKEPKGKRGRPTANHGKERFTILMNPNKRDVVKLIASLEKKQISDLFNEMADSLINEYSKKYPFIKKEIAKIKAAEQKKRIEKI